MKCAICELRKPRRYCPGVRGEICSICCGTERENTVDCPFDCVYLREARSREKLIELDAAGVSAIPFSDVRIPDRFVQEKESTMSLIADAVLKAIFGTPSAIDYDAREAFEALIRTYKTSQSGLIYETRPANPIAANIFQLLQTRIEEGRKQIASNTGVSVRDMDVMAALLIMQRQEYRYNNGRKRGRAFIDHLREFFDDPEAPGLNRVSSPLIV